MTREDAEKIVQILSEKSIEYYVRGMDKEREEVERLKEIVYSEVDKK